jgi:hypothetical protein
MDMSGSMPRRAWVEIRDEAGELLASIPSQINGGTITAELPPFSPGAMGRIQLCTEDEATVYRRQAELEELPAGPQLLVFEVG